jgi:GTPase SAR1 family protein
MRGVPALLSSYRARGKKKRERDSLHLRSRRIHYLGSERARPLSPPDDIYIFLALSFVSFFSPFFSSFFGCVFFGCVPLTDLFFLFYFSKNNNARARTQADETDNFAPTASMNVGRNSSAEDLRKSTYWNPQKNSSGGAPKFFDPSNEKLYEAYSQLHTLAQEFDKPFDSPAVLVVGHQTDGKSALVEALMGFQFNHVGGGTKTRRPIAINMKYNHNAVEPRCYLVKDDTLGKEEELSLPELQAFIESENSRLEQENSFWAKDIVVKIEYKYCPNLTIIDTPGLISAAPGRKFNGMQQQARMVENLVQAKMQNPDYIILCLEDNSDWSNATTRKAVMECDPELRRTVVVSTKFDTRIPQFARAADVEMFMHPPRHLLDSPAMLGGGPFFTSVPSGRVGLTRDSMFRSNDHFREAVVQREQADIVELERRLDRRLEPSERARSGLSQLRHFLERLLQQRYLDNVPTIVPVLEREHRHASNKLEETVGELADMNQDKLKEKGRQFYQHFLEKIPELLRGTLAAPPRVFGETLSHEHIRGGAFVSNDGRPVSSENPIPNAEMRLFGGAQYHRALEEFRQIVGEVQCPQVSREDIINACGVDEVHDGVNYTRTACVIAVSRAKDTFEPFVHQLGFRLAHIARRMLPVAMYLLQKEGRILSGHEVFLKKIGASFAKFVDQRVKECQEKCREDLLSTTNFVTWSLHSGNKSGLRSVLHPDARVDEKNSYGATSGMSSSSSRDLAKVNPKDQKLMDLVENTLWNRNMKEVTLDVVDLLVRQIYSGIRTYVVQSVELKFNCFFLMPLLNDFSHHLRNEMEDAFDVNLDLVFNVKNVRAALEERQQKLEAELEQMEHIQAKFASIHSQLEVHSGASPATVAAAQAARNGTSFRTAADREMQISSDSVRAAQEMEAGIAHAKEQFAHYSPTNAGVRQQGKTMNSPGTVQSGRSGSRGILSPRNI